MERIRHQSFLDFDAHPKAWITCGHCAGQGRVYDLFDGDVVCYVCAGSGGVWEWDGVPVPVLTEGERRWIRENLGVSMLEGV